MQQPSLNPIRHLYPFRTNFLKIGPWKMHYVDEGSGKPVIMLHGNPMWSFFYRKLIGELSKGHRVIAPDHMGCGLSDKPETYDYCLETHIENLERLVDSLRLTDITLVMHDCGGPIGMGFAVRHPQKIKALVAMNTFAFTGIKMPLRLGPCRVPWLGRKLIMDFNLMVSGILSLAMERNLTPDVSHGYMLPYATPESRIALLKFIEDLPFSPEDRSYESILEIEHGLWMFREHPVCLVWGMSDWLFGRRCFERWMLYYPHAAALRLRGAGRYLMEDAPDKVVPFVKDFLSSNGL